MASSVVYSSIFAAVMASLPVVDTQLVCFDTAILDLTEELADPVEVLFGVQLGIALQRERDAGIGLLGFRAGFGQPVFLAGLRASDRARLQERPNQVGRRGGRPRRGVQYHPCSAGRRP